jgi:hypothetical protein
LLTTVAAVHLRTISHARIKDCFITILEAHHWIPTLDHFNSTYSERQVDLVNASFVRRRCRNLHTVMKDRKGPINIVRTLHDRKPPARCSSAQLFCRSSGHWATNGPPTSTASTPDKFNRRLVVSFRLKRAAVSTSNRQSTAAPGFYGRVLFPSSPAPAPCDGMQLHL